MNETISEIIRLNPTASAAFLSQFSPDQLAEYLERLSELGARTTAARSPVRPATASRTSSAGVAAVA